MNNLVSPNAGWHVGAGGGNMDGITADYIIPVLAAGKNITIVAADTAAGLLDACVACRNYQNTTSTLCWRRTDQRKVGGFDFDALGNNFMLPPEANAELHLAAYIPQFPPELSPYHDLVEIIVLNEIRGQQTDEPVYDGLHIGEYLGRFALHYRQIAPANWRLLFFGFASGEPDPDVWEQPSMLEFLRLCGQRPCDTGIAGHEYSYDVNNILNIYPHLLGRFNLLHDVCDWHGIARPRIVISEWGWTLDNVPVPSQAIVDIERAMLYRDDETGLLGYASHPNIAGLAIWWLGPDFGGIANKAQKIIKPLGLYTVATQYDVEIDEPTQPPDGGEGDNMTLKWIMATRHMTEELKPTHARVAFFAKGADGASGDVYLGKTDDFVLPAGATVVSLVLLREEPDEPGNPNPPTLDYLDVTPLGQRDPAWANTILGQNTGHGKTIGNWGCLLVAYNCMARYLNLTERTPAAENAYYVSKGAFVDQYIQPAALRTAYPDKVSYDGYLPRENAAMRPKIREWIDNGWPVPARVDFDPTDSDFDQHWVLIIGYIGDTDFWMMDPWVGDIAIVNSRYAIAGSDVLEAIFYQPSSTTPPPPPPPTGQTYDLLAYMRGNDKQQHTLQYTWGGGGTQTVQNVWSGSDWKIVKGGSGEYEQLYYDNNWIYRAEDTSESPERFYTQSTNGTLGAAWVKRRMAVGETVYTSKEVQHYLKAGCVPQNGGLVTDKLTLTAVYPTYTFTSGLTLPDVIRLEWSQGEGYLFAKGYGLVGFEFSGGKSYISELALGGRADLPIAKPSCIDLNGRFHV